jgi:hypothetical protein
MLSNVPNQSILDPRRLLSKPHQPTDTDRGSDLLPTLPHSVRVDPHKEVPGEHRFLRDCQLPTKDFLDRKHGQITFVSLPLEIDHGHPLLAWLGMH